MSDLTIIPAASFREGRWLNGMGVSWDIAAEPPQSGMNDFGWRFAIARIDADVPFSRYPNVDRVFTLIEGHGLDLSVAEVGTLAVHTLFNPHRFPGDAETSCRLRNGPCRALNLFLRRGGWRAEVLVTADPLVVGACDMALLFALRGNSAIAAERLSEGDAATVLPGTRIVPDGPSSLVYLARLFREG
jgi:uncharacterized protein